MAHAFTPGLHAGAASTIRRRRELPLAGETLVRIGDVVNATSVVARASIEGELRIVRAAEQLGIMPEEVRSVLLASIGSHVEVGQPLAEMRGFFGLFKSTVVSPLAGTIEMISDTTGHIGVRAAPRTLDLPAYISGMVVQVEDGRAAVIETVATFIQGIFGVGGERTGTLQVLDIPSTSRLEESVIPEDCRGKVLVGGTQVTLAALKLASERGAVGVVTGSIDDTTLKEYVGYDIGVAVTGDEPVPTTLIVTEGFGSIPMSERLLSLLRVVSGQPCSINGATQVRAGAVRPEIIVPRSGIAAGVEAQSGGGLSIGSRIRLIRVPYFGLLGRITALPAEPQQIPTGAHTRVLEAILDDGRSVFVPRANVELVAE